MVQTFKEYQLGNHCGHVSYEELEKACFGYIQNIAVLEKRLEIACHVKADDKVGFDFAILDKMDALERERDELTERVRELAAEIAEPTIKELDILYRIRKAIGDNGKMMQDELVDHIEGLARQLEKVQGLEADCEGWKNGQLQMQDISESLFVSNNELGRLLKEARAENALFRKRLEEMELKEG